MSDTPFAGECCADMVETKQRLKTLEEDAIDFKAFVKEMRDAMTYRLPLWATLMIAGLSSAVAWFAK